MTTPRTRAAYGAAENDAWALLGEIEAFCRRRGMSERDMGRRCMHDTTFVRDLRDGRLVKPTTVSRCRAWMAKVDESRNVTPVKTVEKAAPESDLFLVYEQKQQAERRINSDTLHASIIALFDREARRRGIPLEEAMFDQLHPGWRERLAA